MRRLVYHFIVSWGFIGLIMGSLGCGEEVSQNTSKREIEQPKEGANSTSKSGQVEGGVGKIENESEDTKEEPSDGKSNIVAEADNKEDDSPMRKPGEYNLTEFSTTGMCTVTLTEDGDFERDHALEPVTLKAGDVFAIDKPVQLISEGAEKNVFRVSYVEGNIGFRNFLLPADVLEFSDSCTLEQALNGVTKNLLVVDFPVYEPDAGRDLNREDRKICTVPSNVFVSGIDAINSQCRATPNIYGPFGAPIVAVTNAISCAVQGIAEALRTLGRAGTVTFDEVPEGCQGKVDLGTRYLHDNLYTLPVRFPE